MKFYAGIDLHTRNSVVCVIDQKERKIVRCRLRHELPFLLVDHTYHDLHTS